MNFKEDIIEGSIYELDYIVNDRCKLVALTRKNADFIEGVLKLDSNYRSDSDVKPKSNKYGGSIRFWFEEMKKVNFTFEECVSGVVSAIDRTNSTHLMAESFGRDEMVNKICKTLNCKNYKDLVGLLNIPFKRDNKDHILSILTKRIDGKENSRYNLSFASKFCSYAAQWLKDVGVNEEYSKYDNIVSKALPKYVEVYLNEPRKLKDFRVNAYARNTMNEEEKFNERLTIYERYSKDITRILDVLKDKGIEMTRDEFDHIIWYSFK